MASVFNNSSEDLDVLMVGGANKAVASGFAGGAQKTYDVSDRKLVTTIDVWVGTSTRSGSSPTALCGLGMRSC